MVIGEPLDDGPVGDKPATARPFLSDATPDAVVTAVVDAVGATAPSVPPSPHAPVTTGAALTIPAAMMREPRPPAPPRESDRRRRARDNKGSGSRGRARHAFEGPYRSGRKRSPPAVTTPKAAELGGVEAPTVEGGRPPRSAVRLARTPPVRDLVCRGSKKGVLPYRSLLEEPPRSADSFAKFLGGAFE